MAKLTRYTSFEALKSDIQPAKLNQADSAKAHAEFEEFVKLLQRELAAKKSAKPSDER
ncbi:hypothetical protein [Hymenobacter negativus]|uniref:Uncharacterized protein n=1 Tax=Hymenobacter negativus TaxID=2795026 RepID=A0ABS3QFX7_9BACT|nr:hypothetical protein [Hymenobacter negativus]MBO2010155.1 hypothetical protein [Hymenobacter negativus]